MVVPIRPPWNDMPPFHISRSYRVCGDGAKIVKQDVADAPAKHDAAGCPQDEVVKMLRRDWRCIVWPQARRKRKAAGIKPAEHDAGDIGNAVPMDRQRPERQGNRIDIRKWHDGKLGGSG